MAADSIVRIIPFVMTEKEPNAFALIKEMNKLDEEGYELVLFDQRGYVFRQKTK